MLRRATPGTVAQALGLTYRADGRPVDLVVVGAGPAGLAAAVYGASEGLPPCSWTSSGLGGQAAKSARIENYLGFPQGVSGADLTRLAMVQALKFGVRIHSPCAVAGLDLSDDRRPVVLLEDGARIPVPRGDRRYRGALPASRHPTVGDVRAGPAASGTRRPSWTSEATRISR